MEEAKREGGAPPRIDGRIYPDGRMEVFHGRTKERVVPDDGTDRSGVAHAIRKLQRRLGRAPE